MSWHRGESRHPSPTRPLAGVARRVLVLVASCAIVAGACDTAPGPAVLATLRPTSPSPTAPGPSGASVAAARWVDCGGGFQCATVAVPQDYDAPGGPKVNLSIIRLPATRPTQRIGALLVNPGGPGASGVEFVQDDVKIFPETLRKRFDIVGFDPRGVNLSTPVRCQDNLDGHVALDRSPDNNNELDDLVVDARSFAKACDQRNGSLLAHISTEDVARDLEMLRIAMGEPKISYMGFSYGTLIGALYAQQFPTHIRAMVLDGAIDPALDWKSFRSGQARAFEASLSHFLANCSRDRNCYFYHGSGTRRAFDQLMASIDAHPMKAIRVPDRRVLTTGLAWQAVAGSMYTDSAWPALALGLELARRGDGSVLLLMTDPFNGRNKNGSYSNMIDAYTGNTCADFAAPRDVSSYTALAASLKKSAPHFGSLLAYNDLSCAFWPVIAERTPARVAADGSPPILVVGTTGDPATPYAWAKSLAGELSAGILLTRKGEGHTAFAASACIDRAVHAYLVDLKTPRDGTTCD
jgi:pimeloyl-ACP methyl ester carboxylesterase